MEKNKLIKYVLTTTLIVLCLVLNTTLLVQAEEKIQRNISETKEERDARIGQQVRDGIRAELDMEKGIINKNVVGYIKRELTDFYQIKNNNFERIRYPFGMSEKLQIAFDKILTNNQKAVEEYIKALEEIKDYNNITKEERKNIITKSKAIEELQDELLQTYKQLKVEYDTRVDNYHPKEVFIDKNKKGEEIEIPSGEETALYSTLEDITNTIKNWNDDLNHYKPLYTFIK